MQIIFLLLNQKKALSNDLALLPKPIFPYFLNKDLILIFVLVQALWLIFRNNSKH